MIMYLMIFSWHSLTSFLNFRLVPRSFFFHLKSTDKNWENFNPISHVFLVRQSSTEFIYISSTDFRLITTYLSALIEHPFKGLLPSIKGVIIFTIQPQPLTDFTVLVKKLNGIVFWNFTNFEAIQSKCELVHVMAIVVVARQCFRCQNKPIWFTCIEEWRKIFLKILRRK